MRTATHDLLAAAGWNLYEATHDRAAYYRWWGGVRHEIHLIYDRAGRLQAWSTWENRRTHIDQGAGLRQRLNEFADGAAS